MTDYFVPDTTFETRQDTATALTGAADEFGISQRAVRAAQGGFFVREDLYDKVFGGDGNATVDPDGDNESDESDNTETPEDDPSSEEQTDKAPAKKSRSKK